VRDAPGPITPTRFCDHVLVQALPGRLTYYLIGQADSRGRFEGLLHIKRFTGGYNHPGYARQLVG